MRDRAVLALKVVVVLSALGTLVVQGLFVPLIGVDLAEVGAPARTRWSAVVILFLGVVAVQAVLVAVWRLGGMVGAGAFFSTPMFRWVDVIIAAVSGAAVLLVALGVVLAPGEAVPPGFVLLLGGAALLVGGMALVLVILRALLGQAIARDAEADLLQAELEQVI